MEYALQTQPYPPVSQTERHGTLRKRIDMTQTVADVMHTGVITCLATDSVQVAARLMVEHDISSLVVTDETENMVGLVTRTDIVKTQTELAKGTSPAETAVSTIMTPNVVSVHKRDPMSKAVELILEKHIHRVVVVDDGTQRPIGVLSVTDIVQHLAR